MNKKLFISIVVIVMIAVFGALYFYLTQNNKIPTPSVSQGLYGRVTLYGGNCMPGAGGCKTSPVSRIIYIREPVMMGAMERTYLKEKTNLIKQIRSDNNGNYQVELPVGTFSVFVEDNGKEYCNSFGGQGEVCQVKVGTGTAEYNIKIDHAVW